MWNFFTLFLFSSSINSSSNIILLTCFPTYYVFIVSIACVQFLYWTPNCVSFNSSMLLLLELFIKLFIPNIFFAIDVAIVQVISQTMTADLPVLSSMLSRLFESSQYLDDVSLHHLVDALCRLSAEDMDQASNNKVGLFLD